VHVLVTGASGFVGSWTVAALLDAGHEVTALVRDPEKAVRVLGARGVDDDAVRLAPGDILDAGSVEEALDGCEGAIHAAAAIGVTSGGRVSVLEQNVTGTRNVVGLALAAGCDPVVHLSTVAVFVPPSGPIINSGSRLASPRTDYGRSKVIAERELRVRQQAGDPVTIVYPGGILGPDQPQLDATLEGIAGARRSGWPMAPGGVCLLDVRDLAQLLVAAMAGGQGPRRLLAGGHYLTWPELGDLTDDILGVRARRVPFPKPLIYATGSALDLLRRRLPVSYPLTRDAAEIMVTMVPTDDRPTREQLGVTWRPVRESLTDALTWLVREGHLAGRAAGRLSRQDGGLSDGVEAEHP
jgi:nucleoside-diphosphate-sugar epimerase